MAEGNPMTTKPTVSIITPFYNAERFLLAAVESVLGQTYRDWELLLVDDGSTDESTRVAQSYAAQYPSRIQYLEHPHHVNRGISATRNLGLRQARGEFVASLDADDVWMPEKLEEQVAILRAHAEVAMVFGRSLYWSSWNDKPGEAARDRVPESRLPREDVVISSPELAVRFVRRLARTPCPSSMMVRREIIERLGGFGESLPGAEAAESPVSPTAQKLGDVYEDQALLSKVCLEYPVFASSNVWDKYRIHPDSCYARAKADDKRTAARLKYLNWLDGYLSTRNGVCEPVREAVQAELRALRPPALRRAWQSAGRLPVIGGLKRRAQAALRRRAAQTVILHYHRVAEVPCDPHRLCVTPQRFAEQLEVLRKHGRLMRLQDLVKRLDDRRRPHVSFVVTFDDGYADNFHNAKPLLERLGAPATVFVATGAVEMSREFWWDELERLLLRPGKLPDTLEWRVNGTVDKFELAEAAQYSEADQRGHRDWNLAQPDDPSARHKAFRLLYQQLLPLPTAEKRRVLGELASSAGTRLTVRPTHRGLSQDEIVRLAEGELVEIGAHTVNHMPLTSLAPDAQRWEIEQSRTLLRKLLGQSVTSFAYPHDQCSPETAALVRECGFTCACGGARESVRRGADVFQLPRLLVQNWDGEQFEKQLEGWLSA